MMTKNPVALSFLAVLSAIALVISGCSLPEFGKDSGTPEKKQANYVDDTFKVVTATELKALEGLAEKASEDLGFNVELEFAEGTIENTTKLAAGEFDLKYDATWFATNRYAKLSGADEKQRTEESLASSPVILGLRPEVASDLGWSSDNRPSWSEIEAAANEGKLSFGMTDPSSSNSGFSVLSAVATAMADTGGALQLADVERIVPELQSFFKGQALTSGSSGWLADKFREENNSKVNALFTYEAQIIELAESGVDLVPVVPADGVVSADYPLSVLTLARESDAADKAEAFAAWVNEHPEELTAVGLRPGPDASSADLHPKAETGVVVELPFPASEQVREDLVLAYGNKLRKPGEIAFVLDTSGSMLGVRMTLLQQTMRSLVDGTARTDTADVSFRDRESVRIIQFSESPYANNQETFYKDDAAKKQALLNTIDSFPAEGATAMYDALAQAYESVENNGNTIPSIVLMTDGENNRGMGYQEFEAFYRALPEEKRQIPTFVIAYGEANTAELEQLAGLTGGKLFDAMSGDLAAAFKEIRSYQ